MTRAKRLMSALLDHIIMTFVCVPILWLSDESRFMPFAWTISFLLYANKDFFNGRSVAKRLLNMQIINSSNHIKANQMQYFVRNLTILIWPIEVLFLLKNPRKRIGDYLAKTECAESAAA